MSDFTVTYGARRYREGFLPVVEYSGKAHWWASAEGAYSLEEAVAMAKEEAEAEAARYLGDYCVEVRQAEGLFP